MKSISTPLLITGAAGFIGANLVNHFAKKYEVHVIVRKNTSLWRLNSIKKEICLHSIDLLDKSKVIKLLNKVKPKVIYHLASYGNYSYQQDVEQIIHTNIIGTFNLLNACSGIGIKCFINAGTSSEYGYKKHPMRETDRLEPTSFYAASKCSTTLFGQVFYKLNKLPIVTVRLFSVYGPYEDRSRFIPTIINHCYKNESIQLTSQTARRDFIYIEDVVRAFDVLTRNISKVAGKIINIGTGKQYSNEEVVQILFKTIGVSVPVQKSHYPNRSWDTPYWVANRKKALSFNWYPRFTISDGLKKTAAWYKKNQSYYDI